MSTLEIRTLADVQASGDTRGVYIDQVGVGGLRYPIAVEGRDGNTQQTICEAELTVSLAAEVRGTHMSRFVEALHERRIGLSPHGVLDLTRHVALRLDAPAADVRLMFPFFVPRAAPVTGEEALLGIDCTYIARIAPGVTEINVGVRVPVTSLCPCSKEIADYSAHSQRGHVDLEVRQAAGQPELYPEDLLEVCDGAASAPVYPLLKRPDERHVTMLAYDQPAFVEDLARESAVALQADPRVASFRLEVSNQESIHDHQAIARVTWRRE
jgi:GTP cyclohydrolase I